MTITINNETETPIYEQIRNQIVIEIASGGLKPGESLPSVRKLGADLGVNFHTVNKAYASLCKDGYLSMDKRKGAVIEEKNNKNFLPKLNNKILITAAEALCHGIDEEEFLTLCAENYYKAKNSDEAAIVETELKVRLV